MDAKLQLIKKFMEKDNIHIRISYNMLDKYLPVVQKADVGVELFVSSHFLDRQPLKKLELLEEYLGKGHNLSLHAPFMDLSPGGFDEQVRTFTVKRVTHAIQTTRHLSPKRVVVHSGYQPYLYNVPGMTDFWVKNSVETWQKILEACPTERFALENVFEEDPDTLIKLIHEVGSDRFGFCFDIGHFNIFSRISLEEWLDKTIPYMTEMHLHDNNGKEDQHLALGKASIDFDALFKKISSMAVAPIYTVEAHTLDGVSDSLKYFGLA